MLDTFKTASPEALAQVRELMDRHQTDEFFIGFPNGSHYDHLIKQMGPKCGVLLFYADPATVMVEDVEALRAIGLKGMVGTGGPVSVYTDPPPFDLRILGLGIPFFGICLSFQQWAQHVGARVSAGKRQFSVHDVSIVSHTALLAGCPSIMPALQSHGDVIHASDDFTVLATCEGVVAAGMRDHLYGVQFHPECSQTLYGQQIFENFFFNICGAKTRFPAEDAKKKIVADLVKLRESGARVLFLMSGGTDSSIAVRLCKEAGFDRSNLRGLYIKGVDRKDDMLNVMEHFGNQDWIEVVYVDATARLLEALKGKTGMKEKRADGFIPVYEQIASEVAEEWSEDGKYVVYLGQGTLYTDATESGGGHQTGSIKKVQKRHHNWNNKFISPRTGERFQEVTPLIEHVKDTGRIMGDALALDHEVLYRQPFPGPGMVVRGDGEITAEKLAILRAADDVWIGSMRDTGHYEEVWQSGASLLQAGLSDDVATAEHGTRIFREELKRAGIEATGARAELLQALHTYSKGEDTGSAPILVLSTDSPHPSGALSWDILDRVQRRIANEVEHIGAVCYRLSAEENMSTDPTLMLWGVHSTDGLTAMHAEFPWDFLDAVKLRLFKEVRGFGTVIFRITNKPISTIEIG